MKILFIYQVKEFPTFNKPLLNQMEIPLGISYISSLLKKNGHETEGLVLQKIRNKELKKIIKFKPELICFSAISSNYNKIRKISRIIKKYLPKTPHLIGGQHVSMNCDTILENSEFDYLCIGEGEETTLELVNNLTNKKNKKIKGLWVKNRNKIIKNPKRKFINKLDSLPLPDREMWKEYVYNYNSSPTVIIGRGCPYNCTYCSNKFFKKVGDGKFFRLRKVDSIINEIKRLKNKKTKKIRFELDTLDVSTKYLERLCKELNKLNKQSNFKLNYSANVRINNNTNFKKFFSLLKIANFENIRIGVEQGSEEYRKRFLNRHESNDKIIEATHYAKKNKLKVFIYLMFGLPDENDSDLKKTIELVKIIKPHDIYKNFFYPIKGTELYDYCKKNNYLKKRGVKETINPSLNNQKINNYKIIKNYILFEYYINNKKLNFKIIKGIINNMFVVITPFYLLKKEIKKIFWLLTNSKIKTDEFA